MGILEFGELKGLLLLLTEELLRLGLRDSTILVSLHHILHSFHHGEILMSLIIVGVHQHGSLSGFLNALFQVSLGLKLVLSHGFSSLLGLGIDLCLSILDLSLQSGLYHLLALSKSKTKVISLQRVLAS